MFWHAFRVNTHITKWRSWIFFIFFVFYAPHMLNCMDLQQTNLWSEGLKTGLEKTVKSFFLFCKQLIKTLAPTVPQQIIDAQYN